MQLDKLLIPINAKNSWQCFDLGCKVALHFYVSLVSAYFLVSLPFIALAVLLSFSFNFYLGFLAFWLFKPWYERALLFILSRSIFDKPTSVKEALLAWPSQVKPLWFSSITFRRLAPSRSFDVAVCQLENLRGKKRVNRLGVLHRNGYNNTGWWTVLCAHWEMFLLIGLFTLAQILLPLEFGELGLLQSLYYEEKLGLILYVLFLYLAAILVAPFYVAGGFIAYLNRRVILEAWDIELSFKKWAKDPLNQSKPSDVSQNKDKTKLKTHAFIVASMVFTSQFISVDTATAQEVEIQESIAKGKLENTLEQFPLAEEIDREAQLRIQKQEQNKQKAKDELEAIMNETPFGGKETVTRYRFKFNPEEEEDEQEVELDSWWMEFFAGLSKFLASIIQIVFWILFASAFAYVIYRNWSKIEVLFSAKSSSAEDLELPTFIATSFNEKLPDEIAVAVRQSIDKQKFRHALSLLLRASLVKLSEYQTLHITKSMTENECLHLIKSSSSNSVYEYMSTLFQQWMKMAWAHQLPSSEQLLDLVDAYENQLLVEITKPNLSSSKEGEAQ